MFVFSGACYNTIRSLAQWTGSKGISLQPFKLFTNHRSTNRIVAASELLLPNDDRALRNGVVGNGEQGTAVKVSANGDKVVGEICSLIRSGTAPQSIVVLRHKNWTNDDTKVLQLRQKGIAAHVAGQGGTLSFTERSLIMLQVCIGIEEFYDEMEDKLHCIQVFLRSLRGAHGCPVNLCKAIEVVMERTGCDVDVLFSKKKEEVARELVNILKLESESKAGKKKEANDAKGHASKKQKTTPLTQEPPDSQKLANMRSSFDVATALIKGFNRNVERLEQGNAILVISLPTKAAPKLLSGWEPLQHTGCKKTTAKLIWSFLQNAYGARIVNTSQTRHEIDDVVNSLKTEVQFDFGLELAPMLTRKLAQVQDCSTSDKIIFTTIHKFKGDERDVCFVIDMKEPWFKEDDTKLAALASLHSAGCHNRAGVGRCSCTRFLEQKQLKRQAAVSEAMRLMYVAASRAKKRLYMSSADAARPLNALQTMAGMGVAELW